MNTGFDKRHREDRLKNNVSVYGERHVRLPCGHDAIGQPVARLGDKRWYECPQGCGLQRSRK